MQSTISDFKVGQMDNGSETVSAKASRAARFGLVTAGDGAATDEKKAARAARFADLLITTQPSSGTNSSRQQATSISKTDAEKVKEIRAARFSAVKLPDQRTTITKSLGNKQPAGKQPEPPKQDDPIKLARAARFAQTKLN